MNKVLTHTLFADQTSTAASTSIKPVNANKVFHALGDVSTSTGSATIEVQGSMDGTNWVVLDTLSLTLGTAVTSDSGVVTAPWKFIRGEVTAISGTDAQVSLFMGCENK